MVKEEYTHAEGSPVLEKKPYESSKLTNVYHFSLEICREFVTMMMLLYYIDDTKSLYRAPYPVVAMQDLNLLFENNFEAQLNYFMRKARKHIKTELKITLTRKETKEIRTYLRTRYKEVEGV